METVNDNFYRVLCNGCLSVDRNLITINASSYHFKIFRQLLGDCAGNRFDDPICAMEISMCWECVAMMKKCEKFKKQVQSAHEHIRVLAMSHGQETLDHTYMSQSLSSLEYTFKRDYDCVFVDYMPEQQWSQPYITITTSDNVKNESYDVSQALGDHISLAIDDQVLEVPELVLKNPITGALSHIVVGTDALVSSVEYSQPVKGELADISIEASAATETSKSESNKAKKDLIEAKTGFITEYIMSQEDMLASRVASATQMLKSTMNKVKDEPIIEAKSGFITEYMSHEDMLASREELKKKVQYVSAVYKCELCIMDFYLQQQVEEHYIAAHREHPGKSPCKICYVYLDSSALQAHLDNHYLRYICKLCSKVEYSIKMISQHVQSHMDKKISNNIIQIGDTGVVKKRRKKKTQIPEPISSPKPGDLRKLLSKTTIVGYKCLECDMFFKNSRARKNHVARFHREGLQCDHCKKRFVNKTTLVTHLKLHQGPLPREQCPICNKMVRVVQLKYHIQRHKDSTRFECQECNKVFSHLATYQAHLKYSRAHASDSVFKFSCPMCHKGYPTKEGMQDHFNYQHLGKTTHRCPICSKPIASKTNVLKHIMRIHREKKEKPKTHTCNVCEKKFSDKKALNQHVVIHSGERPLMCDICTRTFKQKASLYTHKKRVHKVVPAKKVVEFMDKTEPIC